MARQRTKWNKATKFWIAMEAYKGERSITDLAEEYGVNSTHVHQRKKEPIERGPEIFPTNVMRNAKWWRPSATGCTARLGMSMEVVRSGRVPTLMLR